MGPCKTVILMDHRASLLQPSGLSVAVDEISAIKPLWTAIMENTVEYARILLDVCSAIHSVFVVAGDTKLYYLNSWTEPAGITEIVRKLASIGPPSEESPGLTSILQECVEIASSKSQLEEQAEVRGDCLSNSARIVLFTSCQDTQDLLSVVNQCKQGLDDSVTVSTLIFNIVTDNERVVKERGDEVHHVTCDNLYKCVLETVIRLHKLTITTITSIPMKEEQSSSTQAAAYNVDIVHPEVTLHGCPTERLTMKWLSPKNAQNINLKNCIATYPITPLDVAERPTICLVNFLLVGKQVVLEYPKKNICVVLLNHGGTIVMHYLSNSKRSVLDDPLPVLEGPGGKVSDYRTEEMVQCIEELMMCPHPPSTDPELGMPVPQSITEVQKLMSTFPLSCSTSVLYSCGLGTIYTILARQTLTDDQVAECKQVIYRVQGIEMKKEPISFKVKSGKRDAALNELWHELERLVLSMSSLSPQHGKVKDCLYMIRKPTINEESLLALSDVKETRTRKKRSSSTDESDRDRKMVKLSTPGPCIVGEKISLLKALPKKVAKEFAGKLNGVTKPEDLYQEFNARKQKLLLASNPVRKEGKSPYGSPQNSPRYTPNRDR